MTPSEYKGRLSMTAGGGYLFCGEEMYLANRYLEMTIQAHFPDAETALFNHIRLNEESFSNEKLTEAIEALPIFAERKLIEIRDVNIDAMKEDAFSVLISVLEKLPEYEYNTLLFVASSDLLNLGTAKKPSARFAALSKVLEVVRFEKQTGGRLVKWLSGHFGAWGVVGTADVCAYLIEYSGSDMQMLSLQVEKIAAYVLAKGRGEVTREDVLLLASPGEEEDAFALSDAVLCGDARRALALLRDKERRKERPELTLAAVSSVFGALLRVCVMRDGGMREGEIAAATGMHAYRVGLYLKRLGTRGEEDILRALECLSRADVAMKTSGLDTGILLQTAVLDAMKGL